MAVLDTVAHRRPAGSRSFSFFVEFLDSLAQRRAWRQTRAELSRLSDSELEDIGLTRHGVLSGNFVRGN